MNNESTIAQSAERLLNSGTESLSNGISQAKSALAQEAFAPTPQHEWRNVGITAASGFAIGSTLTAGGEIILTKAAEPLARIGGTLALGLLGGGRAAAELWYAPPLRAIECITPKTVLAGGAIAAGLTVGAYELYENWNKK